MTGVGWFAAIIIGAVAGWLAEQVMKSNMGLLMNIILGIRKHSCFGTLIIIRMAVSASSLKRKNLSWFHWLFRGTI